MPECLLKILAIAAVFGERTLACEREQRLGLLIPNAKFIRLFSMGYPSHWSLRLEDGVLLTTSC